MFLNRFDSRQGLQAPHLAVKFGHFDCLRTLVELKADVNAAADGKSKGVTPLHLCCVYDRPEEIRSLLRARGDPNVLDEYGRTPLMAMAIDSAACVQALVAANADVNFAGDQNKTALHELVENGFINAARELVQSQASVEACDSRMRTPMSLARHQPEMREMLEASSACLSMSWWHLMFDSATDDQGGGKPI